MACRSNYRVKLDLSKYHRDARRFSWIYVNSTSVWFISHLKRHIRDIFDIEEPFHLLLNGNEYLPPAEDVRVLEENEIIVVEPGSGIVESAAASSVSLPVSDMENGYMKSSSTTDATVPYLREKKPRNGAPTPDDSVASILKADATVYHSMVDVTEMESGRDCEPNEDESVGSGAARLYAPPRHKRKRIRKKRTKSTEVPPSPGPKNPAVRRPIADDRLETLAPGGTHIRFDNLDEGNDATKENAKYESSANSLPFFNSLRSEGLSNLLALANCSSPLTFPNKRAKHESGPDGSDPRRQNDERREEAKTRVPAVNGSSTTASLAQPDNAATNDRKPDECVDAKPEDFPSLECPSEIGDTVAFKVLRIGSGYTPEVSNYIVGETVDRCPKNSLYTFKILSGQSEFEGPSGKFSLPDEEDEPNSSARSPENDTVQFNFSQLIEPRLIKRK